MSVESEYANNRPGFTEAARRAGLVRKRAKKASPVSRLMVAMFACAGARGEARWTNGYRTGRGADSTPEGDRLYAKEQRQWEDVERREAAFRRLAQRILAETNRAALSPSPSEPAR